MQPHLIGCSQSSGSQQPVEHWIHNQKTTWKWSKSRNRPYYFNAKTNESVWDKPEGFNGPAAKPPGSEGKVRASHLLVKHSGSRRPSSWREDKITRSVDEATAIIKGYREQIVSGETDLASLAKVYSDCSSARDGGDLNFFGRGQMQKSFEDATYALEVGQLSEPIYSDSGVHLILRTA
ncbi:Peptidyl-prolyl cis-trans isomerase NIMA-interacting protein 1 [Rhizoclosmatium hyalinum]|nr:Peptidyl-prolyl cis-trans isomerase NIMA-interacting protein 1 [Rhizoclosmatium hyalinum]